MLLKFICFNLFLDVLGNWEVMLIKMMSVIIVKIVKIECYVVMDKVNLLVNGVRIVMMLLIIIKDVKNLVSVLLLNLLLVEVFVIMMMLLLVKFWINCKVKNNGNWLINIDKFDIKMKMIKMDIVICLWLKVLDKGLKINWFSVRLIIVNDNVNWIFDVVELKLFCILGNDGMYIFIVSGLKVVMMFNVISNKNEKCFVLVFVDCMIRFF